MARESAILLVLLRGNLVLSGLAMGYHIVFVTGNGSLESVPLWRPSVCSGLTGALKPGE